MVVEWRRYNIVLSGNHNSFEFSCPLHNSNASTCCQWPTDTISSLQASGCQIHVSKQTAFKHFIFPVLILLGLTVSSFFYGFCKAWPTVTLVSINFPPHREGIPWDSALVVPLVKAFLVWKSHLHHMAGLPYVSQSLSSASAYPWLSVLPLPKMIAETKKSQIPSSYLFSDVFLIFKINFSNGILSFGDLKEFSETSGFHFTCDYPYGIIPGHFVYLGFWVSRLLLYPVNSGSVALLRPD